MAGYCAHSALYDHGLPRGAIANPGRLAASALAASDAISIDVHGFDLDDPVTVRADAGGSLPAPLAEGVTYYAKPLTESTFALAATAGGATINLTTDGVRVVVIAPLPVDAAISWGARIIDDMLPAHVVPLAEPYPEIIVFTNAELAAGKLAGRGGFTSRALGEIVDEARKRLARWASGIPIRGTNTQPRSGLSAVAAPAASGDAADWRRYGGL